VKLTDVGIQLLIRLERRAHRINFAKQIVEAHEFTYADKKLKLVKAPGNIRISTRVTLPENYTSRGTDND